MKSWAELGISIPPGASGEIRTLCPECSSKRQKNSKDKCLAVNLTENVWHCHHCGQSGSRSGVKTQEEIRTYFRPRHVHVDLPEAAIEWLRGRGISIETAKANGLCAGRFDKDSTAIKFPYFKGGIVVNAKYRTRDKRFRQEKNPEPCLYRFDALAQTKPSEIIICEGEMDALACYEAGLKNATSVPNGAPAPNAKNYTREFLYMESAGELLAQAKKIILAVDNDGPGKLLEQELARRIGVEKCYRVQYPDGCKDANDVLLMLGKLPLITMIEEAKPYPISGIFTSEDIQDLICNLYENGERRGLSTGWTMMDSFYTVKSGQMTIVTGIPSSGKSNWVDALIVNLAERHNWSFAIFSPENWPIERHAQTLIEKMTRKSFEGYGHDKWRLPKEELDQAIHKMKDRFFFIMPEDELLTVETILEKAKVSILRHGVKGLVIDPWNELEHEFGKLSETQYISASLGRIRRFARRHDIHVWIVAHPQKLIKNKDTKDYDPPTMYEISGGAHWKNKADVGICVHRPDHKKDETEVYIQKVRFREVGKPGGVRFDYLRNCGVYTDKEILG